MIARGNQSVSELKLIASTASNVFGNRVRPESHQSLGNQ